MKRTLLPLNALRVFDAAARHLSFTRAADELAVTPAAVGQQIRALEDVLGVVLFRRTPKGLELTDEATAGLEALRIGFLHFEDAVRAMQEGQSSLVYTIACPRDVFATWLAPRLAAFRAENPEVRINLVPDAAADFTEANPHPPVPRAEGPGQLAGVRLGVGHRVTGVRGPWIAWPGDPNPGGDNGAGAPLSVGDAGQALAAANAGLGRARVPALLLGADEGGEREDCRFAYWLVAPLPQWRQKKVKALVGFLAG